jgi:cyclin-dependent kinase 8/11
MAIFELINGPTSVFQQQLSSPSQLPPQRRITQDDAPSMMPAQATQAQQPPAQFTQQQHLQTQTHGSAASFASVTVSAGAGGHTRKKARLG